MMRLLSGLASVAVFFLSSLCLAQAAPGPMSADGQYVIIGFNDLGMHCINPRFADICLLPPANNLNAVVIRRGEDPQVVTGNLTVRYSFADNTTVAGKSDFWVFAPKIFNVNLTRGIGLAGNGLSGAMKPAIDHFEAKFLPVLPRNDNGTWNPYQVATLKLKRGGTVIAQTSVVVPVSDEMNCQKCHSAGGPGAGPLNKPTVEQNILKMHDIMYGTKLMANRPVLCSGCHADPALSAPGKAGISSLSKAIHTKHASLAVADQPACYDCHPGAKTQCSRSAITAMGPVAGNGPNCELCHGNLKAVARKLNAGRQPWVQEPTCTKCHDATYDTGTTLYRNAKGHGGVPCIVCHNSPHAWWPAMNAVDNAQPMALQGTSSAIGKNACNVCHTDGRTGVMPPHGADGGGN